MSGFFDPAQFNLSDIKEVDESLLSDTTQIDLTKTPRSIACPTKKARPMNSSMAQPRTLADKNLEESLVEDTTSYNFVIKTSSNLPRKTLADKNLEETLLEETSIFSNMSVCNLSSTLTPKAELSSNSTPTANFSSFPTPSANFSSTTTPNASFTSIDRQKNNLVLYDKENIPTKIDNAVSYRILADRNLEETYLEKTVSSLPSTISSVNESNSFFLDASEVPTTGDVSLLQNESFNATLTRPELTSRSDMDESNHTPIERTQVHDSTLEQVPCEGELLTNFSEISVLKPMTPPALNERETTEVFRLRDSIDHAQFLKKELEIMAETRCKCDLFSKTIEEFKQLVTHLQHTRRSSMVPDYSKELEGLKHLVTTLEAQIKHHEDQAIRQNSILETKESELHALKKQNEVLLEHQCRSNESLLHKSSQLDALNQLVSNFEGQIKQYDEHVAQHNLTLETKANEVSELQKEVTELLEYQVRSNRSLKQKESELDDLKQIVATTEAQLKVAKDQIEAKEIELHEFRRLDFEGQIKQYEEQVAQHNFILETKANEVIELQKEVTELLEHQVNSNRSLKQKDIEIGELRNRLASAEDQIKEHEDRLNMAMADKDKCLGELHKQIEELLAYRIHSSEALKQKESELDDLKQIVATTEAQLKVAKDQIEAKKIELHDLRQRLHERSNVSIHENDIALVSRLQEQLDKFHAKEEAFRGRIKELEDECDQFDEMEAKYREEVYGMKIENLKLKCQAGLITPAEAVATLGDASVKEDIFLSDFEKLALEKNPNIPMFDKPETPESQHQFQEICEVKESEPSKRHKPMKDSPPSCSSSDKSMKTPSFRLGSTANRLLKRTPSPKHEASMAFPSPPRGWDKTPKKSEKSCMNQVQ